MKQFQKVQKFYFVPNSMHEEGRGVYWNDRESVEVEQGFSVNPTV